MLDAQAKSAIFIAYTPFQLLSASCLACSREGVLGEVERRDLVVFAEFRDAESHARRAEQSGLFDAVILCKPPRAHRKHAASMFVARRLLRSQALRDEFFQAYPELADKRYDILAFSYPSEFALETNCCCMNDNSVSVMFDDGSGSRNAAVATPFALFDDIVDYSHVKAGRAVRMKHRAKYALNCLTRGRLRFNVTDLFVFQPDDEVRACYRDVQVRGLEVPAEHEGAISPEVLARSESVERYRNVKAVVFGTSRRNAGPSEGEELLNRCLDAAVSVFGSENVLFRPHPLGVIDDLPSDVSIDEGYDLWEGLCMAGAVQPSHVLIGLASTALLASMRFGGVEPTIVSVHRMKSGKESFAADAFFDQVVSACSDGSRVFAPATMEELEAVFRRLKAESVEGS